MIGYRFGKMCQFLNFYNGDTAAENQLVAADGQIHPNSGQLRML